MKRGLGCGACAVKGVGRLGGRRRQHQLRYSAGLVVVLVLASPPSTYAASDVLPVLPDLRELMNQFPRIDLDGMGKELSRRLSSLGSTQSASSPGALKASAPYTPLTPEAVHKCVAEALKPGWGRLVIGPTGRGISVFRRCVAGSQWEEVKGCGILKCKPACVVKLFETNDVDLIRSFNPLYDYGFDIERFSPSSKAAYARVRSAFPGLKPRDTVSAVEQHAVPLDLGAGTVFMLRAIDHPEAPVDPKVVRAKILSGMNLIQVHVSAVCGGGLHCMGKWLTRVVWHATRCVMNVLQPVDGAGEECLFTFTQQVDGGGGIPAWIINKLVAREAVQFLARIESAAQKIGD
jgi:hypothetical protein